MFRYIRLFYNLIKLHFTMSLSLVSSDVPLGIKFLQKFTDVFCPRLHFNRETCYRASVAILTYFAYMSYHMSRRPISVVKSVLHRNCSDLPPPSEDAPSNWCEWAPFDGSDANASQLLGEVDSAFLFCYAIAMFGSGFVAERVNLRYFLSIGMLLSGVFSYIVGLAKIYKIHNLWYFIVMQGIGGVVQTTGWPGVVTVMSNWFGKSKRGLIFGFWNSHTSIGNIIGNLISAEYVETDWSLSFIMPGLYIGVVGFIIFLFLVVKPGDVGCMMENPRPDRTKRYRPLESQVINDDNSSGIDSDVDDTEIRIGEQAGISRMRHYADDKFEVQRRTTERTHLLARQSQEHQDQPIGFFQACCIPGVLEFSFALFFSKLVSYTFLSWLAVYVKASTSMGAALSADMAALFDVGGIVGAIVAGVMSDKTEMPASTCALMFILAAPMMLVYEELSTISVGINIILLVVLGLLVNGPYALITTAVSAELGTHHSLEGNAKALATVTAIIDGTGSMGAAVGPLLTGFIYSIDKSWQKVFIMLMISDILAFLFLMRLVKQELVKWRNSRRAGLRIE